MRIVYFGTPQFAANILRLLLPHITPVAIVTKVDTNQGRKGSAIAPPVKQFRDQYCPQIPLFQPQKASSPEFIEQMKALAPDLFVVVAYGEIMKQSLLDVPKLGAINCHASLLPLLRGASPIQQSIKEGFSETGVTIMKMVLAMDAGDILAQRSVPITIEMNASDLENALIEVSAPLLLQVIRQYECGNITAIAQDHAKATYVKKSYPEDCGIDWKKEAIEVHNHIRALAPKPGAFTYIKWGKDSERIRLKILRTTPVALDHQMAAGSIISFDKKEILVACGANAVALELIQLEGKRVMNIGEFVAGHPTPFTIDFHS